MSPKLLDNLHTSVILLDHNFNLTYINYAGEILLQSTARTILGRNINSLIRCPDEDLTKSLNEVLKNKAPITHNETTLGVPDERQIKVDCAISPFLETNKPTQIIIEITTKDQHLRVTRDEQIRHKNQIARDIVRRLAHEVKNPLGGLRGAAQLLEAELNSEELKEYTQVIIKEADRLQQLVDKMLGPNQLPEIAALNIHQVLSHIIPLVRAESPHIEFTLDYDPSIPDIMGDKNQLIQSILNIIGNAVKANDGQGTITLKTRIQRHFLIADKIHRHVLQLDIIDNGSGIPKKIQDKLFFPMISGREDGMGLCLSIALSLIARHHGLIECHSRPGQTIFSIFLPVEP
jgi:two-component system nitrogen regulation sensor histidine kinase GlnL